MLRKLLLRLACAAPDAFLLFFITTHVAGRTASETVQLVNNESVGFSFEVVDASCHSEGYLAKVDINPAKGFVAPHSK